MKRLNYRLLILLFVLVVGSVGGLVALRRFQVWRNANSMSWLAQQRLTQGFHDDSIRYFAAYVALRPNDLATHVELAESILKVVDATRVNRTGYLQVCSVIESEVERNPDNDALRATLALALLDSRKATDSRRHFGILRQRFPIDSIAGKPRSPTAAEDPLDPVDLELKYVFACVAAGERDEAASVAGGLIGFDADSQSFVDGFTPLLNCTDAVLVSELIAGVLEKTDNDTETAARVIRQIAVAYPDRPEGWLTSARWNLAHGDTEGAEEDLAQGLAIAPDEAEMKFMAFGLAMSAKDYVRAKKIIEEGLVAYAKEPPVAAGRADVALATGDSLHALEALQLGLRRNPDNLQLRMRLVDVLLQLNRPAAVEPLLEALREAVGDQHPAIIWTEARLLMGRGEWGQARPLLESLQPIVSASGPLANSITMALVYCYDALGETEKFLEASQRVAAANPAAVPSRMVLARGRLKRGRFEAALADYESLAADTTPELLAEQPWLWQPLINLRIAEQFRRPEEERDWRSVDRLLDLLTSSPSVGMVRGAILRCDVLTRRGEMEAAEAILRAAIAADPATPAVVARLATLLMADGRKEEAEALLAEAPIEIQHSPYLLSVGVAIAAAEQGEIAEARIGDIETIAAQLLPTDATRVLTAIIDIRVGQGNFLDAERLSEKILERDPTDARTWITLLRISLRERNAEKLTRQAKALTELAGDNAPEARVAEAMLLVLGAVGGTPNSEDGKPVMESTSLRELTPAGRRDLSRARELLLLAEQDRPEWFIIQRMLAGIETQQGESQLAIDRLKRLVSQGVNDAESIDMLIRLLRGAGRLDEALSLSAGDQESTGIEAMRTAADIDARDGHFAEAIARGQRLTPNNATDPDQLLWFAALLNRCGEQVRARMILDRAVAVAPDRLDVWVSLIQSQAARGDRPAAEASMRTGQAALASPDKELLPATTADLLGDRAKAEILYRGAVDAAPTAPRPRRLLADFYLRNGRTEQARPALQQIIDMPEAIGTPALAWARRSFAELMARTASFRELDEWVAVLEKNADSRGRLSADDTLLEVNLLSNRVEPPCWRRAADLLEDLAARQRLSLDHRLSQALLWEKLDRWEECREALLQLADTPGLPPHVHAVIAERLLEHGEIADARNSLAKIRALTPDNPATLLLEAQSAAKGGNNDDAREAIDKLVSPESMQSLNPAMIVPVAKRCEELGFIAEADRILVAFAEASPAGILARAAFLGRQHRSDEALDLLEAAGDKLPAMARITVGTQVLVDNGAAPSPIADGRVESWWNTAQEKAPDSLPLLIQGCAIKELIGKEDEAERLCRGALTSEKIPPATRALVANNLALLLARPDTVEEAKVLMNEAIDEIGPHPEVLDTHGLVLLAAGDFFGAISEFQESLLVPTARKYLHLATAQFENGSPDEARAALEAATNRGLLEQRLGPADRDRLKRLETELQRMTEGGAPGSTLDPPETVSQAPPLDVGNAAAAVTAED